MFNMLDTDLYKLTMQYAVLCQYPGTLVRYQFINRNPKQTLTAETVKAVFDIVDRMSKSKIDEGLMLFLKQSCPYFPQWYLDWLLNFRPNVKYLRWENGTFIVEGPWEETIWFEVPLLATVSEQWCGNYAGKPLTNAEIDGNSFQKAEALTLHHCKYIEMGTRRRRSGNVQDRFLAVVREHYKDSTKSMIGTSNVYLAWKHNFRPMGTMAHEWIMAASVLEGERHANRHALNKWYEVYKGNLGIALTDTYGTHSFLRDFDADLAKKYDGVRQDSGNPFTFAERMIEHYKALGIDPKTKTIVFSDGLTVEGAQKLQFEYESQIRCVYGIGTHLTNDFGRPAMNIVMKLTHVKNVPVVKLSDVPTKASGDPDAKRVALWIHNYTPLDADS